MDAKEWQALSEKERRALHEQGKRNLEEGARLAGEAFMHEMEQISSDDALPLMPQEAAEQMMEKMHAMMERRRQQKAKNKTP